GHQRVLSTDERSLHRPRIGQTDARVVQRRDRRAGVPPRLGCSDAVEGLSARLRQCSGMSHEIDIATALRRRASGLLVLAVVRCALVVLRCALDRRYPALAPLHPDLGLGLQLEGRLVETSDPNLDERVAGVGCVEEPRPTAGAEAATVIA